MHVCRLEVPSKLSASSALRDVGIPLGGFVTATDRIRRWRPVVEEAQFTQAHPEPTQ
jgi:hypothetical protein